MNTAISEKLKQIRKKAGLASNQLAEIIGISQPAYSKLETGKSLPRIETVTALYEKLQVDPLWLLTGQTRSKITNPDALRIAEMAQELSAEARQRILEMVERELKLEKFEAEQNFKKAAQA